MNLAKLFEAQQKLDEHIEREHPRQDGEDRLAKKILALMVELGELCQEWRGFKYWSGDREPRREIHRDCPYCHAKGFRESTIGTYDCHCCDGKGYLVKYPLLEEYVDCLHFILSIGLEFELSEEDILLLDDAIENDGIFMKDITEQFSYLFYCASRIQSRYQSLFNAFVGLGEWLGFTWEQVEEAYFQKNAVNHRRQDSGVY